MNYSHLAATLAMKWTLSWLLTCSLIAISSALASRVLEAKQPMPDLKHFSRYEAI